MSEPLGQSYRQEPPKSTREKVRLLMAAGLNGTEISRVLGVSKSTVCHHVRKLGVPARDKFAKRYDWAEVQRYYDEGHSVRECRARFGFANQSWNDAVKRGDVVARPNGMPLDELLIRKARNRNNIKLRLLGAGIKSGDCEECGIAEWRGRPLSMALHHINGDRHDNRLQNLALLCPNCHSQTENFGGRNVAARATPGPSPRPPVRHGPGGSSP
jgi:DNA-binding CsgD family transcriptional regulator